GPGGGFGGPGGPGGSGGPGGRGGGGRMQFGGMIQQAANQLNLSADQKKRLEEILSKYRAEADKMRQDMQATGGDFRQMREKMQPMREKMQSEIDEVLTPEQREKLKQVM